ncbi:MAG: sialidase family protein, partial [Ktedonobacterales bacterium]
RILAVSSRDGGATWSNPVLVAQVRDVPFQFSPEKYRNFVLPAFTADPRTGQLYLAWEDQHNGDPDILLTTSRDAGHTWSAPTRVNDDPLGSQSYHAYQFQPQVAVAPSGVVSVSFFDTRNDPAHRFIDVYLAQSLDHGATFRKNVRVTAQAWDPRVDAPVDGGGAQFIGDYQGLAADDRFVHPFWNDTRTGSQEIYTVAIPSAQPRKP